MSSTDWIVPLPPNFEHGGRRAVGVIPCHGKTCTEWALVRLDKKGIPYAPCDHALSVRGCKRRYDLLPEDIPPQTREHFDSMRADLEHMPADIKTFVLSAWGHDSEKLTNEKLGKPVNDDSNKTENSANDVGDGHQGNRRASDQSGTAQTGEAGTGQPSPDDPANGPRENPDSAGPDSGVEPAGSLGFLGI